MPDTRSESIRSSSAMCSELRSKKYYFLDAPPRTSADLLDASNDCWCAKTMERVGPDHGLVHPDDCGAERSCYRAPAGPPRPSV